MHLSAWRTCQGRPGGPAMSRRKRHACHSPSRISGCAQPVAVCHHSPAIMALTGINRRTVAISLSEHSAGLRRVLRKVQTVDSER